MAPIIDHSFARPTLVSQYDSDRKVETRPTPELPAEVNLFELAGRTAAENALRLVRRFGPDFCYCAPWHTFLVSDTRRWQPDTTRQMEAYALEVARQLFSDLAATSEYTLYDYNQAISFAQRSCSVGGIAEMLEFVRSVPSVHIQPEAMDANPMYLNCFNGALNLQSGCLEPHARNQKFTRLCPVWHTPEATCPRWERFVADSLGNDQARVSHLQRAIAYSLTGDVGDQMVFVCYGPDTTSANVILDLLVALLGHDYGMRLDARELSIVGTLGLCSSQMRDFHGKRLVACPASGNDWGEVERVLASLIHRTPILVGHHPQPQWHLRPTHKFWLSTDRRPNLQSLDDSSRRRISLIPFSSFVPEEPMRRLLEELGAELPGILNWCRAGINSWFHHDGVGQSSADTSSKQQAQARAGAPSRSPAARLIKKRKSGRKVGKS